MKQKTGIKILIAFIVVYFLLVTASPFIIKPIIEKEASNYIQGELKIGSLFLNPFTHGLTAKNITVTSNESTELIKLEKVYLNVDLLPLILAKARIQEFSMQGLQLYPEHESEIPKLDLIHLPLLQVDNIAVGIFSQEVNIETILINALAVNPVLYKAGHLNINTFENEIETLLALEKDETDKNEINNESSGASLQEKPVELEQNEEATQKLEQALANEEPEKTSTWEVEVSTFQLKDGQLNFFDFTVPSGEKLYNQLSISGINTHANELHSSLQKSLDFKLKLRALEGDISIAGSFHPKTYNGDINYQLEKLSLPTLNPYIESHTLLSLASGTLNSSGTIKTQQKIKQPQDKTEEDNQETENQELTVNLNNDTSIDTLLIKHLNYDKALLDCEQIQSRALNFSQEINKLELEKILLKACQIHATLEEDGSSSFQVERTEAAQKTGSGTTASKAETNREKAKPQETPLNIEIAEISLENNALRINDLSQGSPVPINITDINFLLNELGKGAADKTKLKLDTIINGHAPLKLTGNGNFLNEKISTDTQLSLEKLGLKTFSPYTIKLSSRPVEQGVVSINIDTKIKENQLESDNKISIHGIKMGKKQSEGGKLPLALATTVLRDRNGDIHIDVPVSGNLDDPDFSIVKQVLRSLRTIITKAATAPLNVVGGMVTGDGTGSQLITFATNSADLNESAKKKLERAAQLLDKSKELVLESQALLSNEELQILNTEQRTELLKKRVNNITQFLKSKQIGEEQIQARPVATEEANQQGGVRLNVFSR